MTRRPPLLVVAGTDTDVGKTHVACAILSALRDLGLRPLPFKPAESGLDVQEPNETDSARLARAADLPEDLADRIAPYRYGPPLAPGIAEDPHRFLPGAPPPDRRPMRHACDALVDLVASFTPDAVVVELAGGLHVPMPGGTWQTAWIDALADDPRLGDLHVLVVGRLGLGTLNHTRSTIDALRSLGHDPIGFLLSAAEDPDPSASTNAAVLAHATACPHLASLAPGTTTLPDACRDAIVAALGLRPTGTSSIRAC